MTDNSKKDLIDNSENLLSTILDPSITLIFKDLPDYLKSFPLTCLAMQIWNTASSISNLITASKYSAFISYLSEKNIPEKIWNDFFNKHEKDKHKFSENLLFAIDASDSREKAAIIAEFTNELMHEKISYEKFLYFIHVVNSVPLRLLELFSKDYKSREYFYNQSVFGFLYANGFINMLDGNGNIAFNPTQDLTETYKLNEYAKTFGEILETYFTVTKNSAIGK